jgi:hypothetical protein
MMMSFLSDFIAYTLLVPRFWTRKTLPKEPRPMTDLITKSERDTFWSRLALTKEGRWSPWGSSSSSSGVELFWVAGESVRGS